MGRLLSFLLIGVYLFLHCLTKSYKSFVQFFLLKFSSFMTAHFFLDLDSLNYLKKYLKDTICLDIIDLKMCSSGSPPHFLCNLAVPLTYLFHFLSVLLSYSVWNYFWQGNNASLSWDSYENTNLCPSSTNVNYPVFIWWVARYLIS